VAVDSILSRIDDSGDMTWHRGYTSFCRCYQTILLISVSKAITVILGEAVDPTIDVIEGLSRKAFSSVDKNGDSRITKEEFLEWVKQQLPQELPNIVDVGEIFKGLLAESKGLPSDSPADSNAEPRRISMTAEQQRRSLLVNNKVPADNAKDGEILPRLDENHRSVTHEEQTSLTDGESRKDPSMEEPQVKATFEHDESHSLLAHEASLGTSGKRACASQVQQDAVPVHDDSHIAVVHEQQARRASLNTSESRNGSLSAAEPQARRASDSQQHTAPEAPDESPNSLAHDEPARRSLSGEL